LPKKDETVHVLFHRKLHKPIPSSATVKVTNEASDADNNEYANFAPPAICAYKTGLVRL